MNYNSILEVLNDIKQGNIPRPYDGICANLELLMFEKHGSQYYNTDFIKEASIEMFGAYLATPVEGDIIAYLSNDKKWDKETEFGLRRYGYLDKLIAYAEERMGSDA